MVPSVNGPDRELTHLKENSESVKNTAESGGSSSLEHLAG